MPSDERERQFEQALERHIRDRSADVECLDAETLAAYHERTLSLGEMAKCKEHIAGCVRCKETLALVEETNAINAHDWEGLGTENREVLFANPANLPHALRSMRREPLQLEEEIQPAGAMSAGPMKAAPERAVGRTSWKWIVPMGALAAGLLIFVAVRERQDQMAKQSSPIEMAQNRDLPKQEEARPAPASEQPAKDTTQKAARMKQLEKPLGAVTLSPGANKPAQRTDENSAKVGEADKLSRDEQSASNYAEVKPSANAPEESQAGAQTRQDLAAGKVAGAKSAPPPPPNATAGAAAPSISGEKKEGYAAGDEIQSVETNTRSAVLQKQTGKSKSPQFSQVGSSLRQIAAMDSRVVLAPDGMHAWRVGLAGMVEATSDSGKTWSLQTSGVGSDLRGGSAPSTNVCWIVGKAGTILKTIDGGKHWEQIASPLQEDLGGVHAVDAKHASIWNVPKNKSFETADGGLTWTPAANE